MADNHPTVDDVPQNLKPAGIEIPNDQICHYANPYF